MKRDRGPKTAGRYLGALHRFARRYFAVEMERLDLPPVTFPLLMRLLHRDHVSQQDLVQDFLVDKGTLETLQQDADRQAIRQGIADMEAGRVVTLEELDARIQARLRRPLSA